MRIVHCSAKLLRALTLVAAVVGAVVVAGCGGDDDSEDAGSGNGVDRAFTQEMVPHHRSAIDMARIAQQRAQHAQIKTLATEIVTAQDAEITTMGRIQLEELGDVKPTSLGVPAHAMGMGGDVDMLRRARPFDREFIDMMVPHHQGAIRMARAEADKGQNAELRALAEEVIDAQAREIEQMNDWREQWYGRPSPAGGVPREA